MGSNPPGCTNPSKDSHESYFVICNSSDSNPGFAPSVARFLHPPGCTNPSKDSHESYFFLAMYLPTSKADPTANTETKITESPAEVNIADSVSEL